MAWRTWKLHWATIATLAFVEIGMIVTLGVLHHLSDKNQGFAAIKQNAAVNANTGSADFHSIWNVGFLWTSLPSLLMILFCLSWAAVVDSLAEETPMRDLVRSGGSSMEKTLLLDYRTYMTFVRWFPAFMNRHHFLGVCMLFTATNNIVLAPLASRLFAPVPVALERPGTFVLSTSYNTSADIVAVDYAPIFATVTAVELQGGSWPAYTDGIYAYPTFIVPTAANLTQSSLNITGYGAHLDCVQVMLYNISRFNDASGSATLSFSAIDRGCDISVKGAVGSGSSTFLKTQSTLICPQNTGVSRISYFAGAYAPLAPYLLDDLSVISCIPSYTQAHGMLTAPPSLNPLSFSQQSTSTDARINNWRGFEQAMLSLSNIGNSDSQDFTSAFGELILGIARQKNPSAPLSPQSLMQSSSDAFSHIFAVFAQEKLFYPLASDENISGVLTISATRLTVVTWSAYTSIAIIAVLFILTIILIVHLFKYKPVFPEEPCGMAGYASLLHGSDKYHALLLEANQSPNYEGKFQKWLKNSYILGDETCTLNGAGRVIDIQGLRANRQGGK